MSDENPRQPISDMVSVLFWGATQGLARYAEGLPGELATEERRRLLREEARRQGLATLSLLPKWFPPGWESENARNLVLGIVESRFSGHEDLTLGEMLPRLADLLPWDKWLVEYVEKARKSRQVPTVDDVLLSGDARKVEVKYRGLRLPIVFAWVTPFSVRTVVRKEFDDLVVGEFGRVRSRDPETLLMAARYLVLRGAGVKHRMIAEAFVRKQFEGRPEWEDERLRRAELRRMSNLLYQLKKRFAEYVTDTTDFRSPEAP